MSQNEAIEDRLSETTVEQGEVNNSPRLVPVAESIRYRKRAQSAEKQVEGLAEQLAQAELRISKMSKELEGLQVEQELMHKLAAAGAVDLETAVLIAKAKMGAEGRADLNGVIEQLKKEKQYLFSLPNTATTAKKTAGAKERMTSNQTIIERAAKKAATTGNRADLQEYLRLRRGLV